MSLSYGGIDLLLDCDRQVQSFLDEYQPICDLADVVGFEKRQAGRETLKSENANGAGLFYPAYPNPPAARLNELYWPSGATRWSRGYFLATTDAKNEIVALTTASESHTPLDFVAEFDNTITTSLYLLSPRPIHTYSTGGLWMLPLVDERYMWQFRTFGDNEVTTSTTWAALFALLATQLGVSITADSVDSAYLNPDPTELTRHYDNAAMMLDAVSHSVGQRVVRDLDGSIRSESWSTAQATIDANHEGEEYKPWSDISGGVFDRHPVAASVTVVFPKVIAGRITDESYAVTESPTDTTLATTADATKVIYSTTWADFDAEGDTTPNNATEVDAMAEVIASDYYESLERNYDWVFSGVKKWKSNGYDDSIVYNLTGEKIATRIQSLPLNSASEWQLSQDNDIDAVGCCAGYTSAIGTVETCSLPIAESFLFSWTDGGDNVGAAVVTHSGTASNLYTFESEALDAGYGAHLMSTAGMTPNPFTVKTVKRVATVYNCAAETWNATLYDATVAGGEWSIATGTDVTENALPFDIVMASDTRNGVTFTSYMGTLPSTTYTFQGISAPVSGNVVVSTSTQWTASNTTLVDGDVGFESDTGKYKVGIDSTAWNDLDYAVPVTVAAADITDSTSAGQAILTAADNAAIRTLLNVEDGATADQTGAEIKAAYEGEADTNAFTDAEKTLLGNQSGTNTGDQDISGYQLQPSEGAFANGDKTKLDGIEASADVTDAANVTAAGALMDSEVTNLSQVKAFDSSDYATAAQGALADSATQPGDLGTAAAEDVGYFATAAQGSTADSTATGLSNHIGDSSDAHDASAISVADSGALLTATDVEGALAEIAGEVDTNTTGLSDHLGDTTDAHDASAISIADSGGIYTATDVEAALAEVKALADAALQDVIIIQEEQAASTDGGTFTAGAWRTRSLNTESIDTGGNASLSSNQVTLDAGTYDVEFWAVAQRVNRHQTRLQNVTDATTTCLGSTDYAAAGNAGGSKSAGATRFTIASSKAFELQHRCEDTKATNGFGISQSWGVNVYSQVKFHKVA